jgi:hypothetical protein
MSLALSGQGRWFALLDDGQEGSSDGKQKTSRLAPGGLENLEGLNRSEND